MNKQTAMSIAYAQDMLSFLFLDTALSKGIAQIYLFGSAVRGELEKESDIDIFIDTEETAVEKAAKAALSRFYASKDYEKWKHFQFTYPLSIQVGKLSEWQLTTSIAAEGILLYGRQGGLMEGERKVLFILTWPKQKKKYLHLTRALFGRGEEGYKDQGIIAKIGGERLGSQTFMVPQLERKRVESCLQEGKVEYRMKEMMVYG